MRTCSNKLCDKPHHANGFCSPCGYRIKKYGDPNAGRKYKKQGLDIEDNFLLKVTKTDGCWQWIGAKDPGGYGRFWDRKKVILAHRYSFVMHGNPLADDELLDHKCHNPSCVNPDHLRIVTKKQNAENMISARSDSKSGVRGVSWSAHRNAWVVQVGHEGKNLFFGHFSSIDEAEKAAINARNSLFTHNDIDRAALAGELK